MTSWIFTSIALLVTYGTASVSGLSCEQCALATISTSNSIITTDITDSERNTRTDTGCDAWGSSVASKVTCLSDTVKYGKSLTASGTEGTDFVYRCATINVTLLHDFDYQGQTGTDLQMETAERGCVAVPPDNGYTATDTCYDFKSNVFLTSAIADLSIGISYANNQRLASETSGDNVVCFCTADNCNTAHLSDGAPVIIGELTAATTEAPENGASAGQLVGHLTVYCVLLLLAAVM